MADLTLLAPESVATWFEALGGDATAMIVIGEGGPLTDDVLARVRCRASDGVVRVHSGHDSLVRDERLSQILRAGGLEVHAQSPTGVRAGRDKVFARQLLRDADIPLTPWGTDRPPDGRPVLVKSRDSTQSRSIAWADEGGAPIASDSYWEQWIAGPEYSVVGFREGGSTTILPIVSKGPTRRDLLPPWRRARWVFPGVEVPFAAEMQSASTAAAEALDLWGFFEVEFVASDHAQIIEVNPRISGTLRLAAMAADLRIFAPSVFEQTPEVVPAVFVGVEVPFDGPITVEHHLIATSRMTCVGERLEDVVRRTSQAGPRVADALATLPVEVDS